MKIISWHLTLNFIVFTMIAFSTEHISGKSVIEIKSASEAKLNPTGSALKGTNPKVIKFYDPNCIHCRAVKVPFEQLAKETSGLDFIAVNLIRFPELQREYKINGIPTFVVLDNNNKIIDQFSGGGNKQTLKDNINRILGQRKKVKKD